MSASELAGGFSAKTTRLDIVVPKRRTAPKPVQVCDEALTRHQKTTKRLTSYRTNRRHRINITSSHRIFIQDFDTETDSTPKLHSFIARGFTRRPSKDDSISSQFKMELQNVRSQINKRTRIH